MVLISIRCAQGFSRRYQYPPVEGEGLEEACRELMQAFFHAKRKHGDPAGGYPGVDKEIDQTVVG
jgi:hypothetical protein